MNLDNRRSSVPDRRRVPRGGRRTADRPGQYPIVLVAESCADVRRPLVRYLAAFHFRVVEASDGNEMLKTITGVRPHVVLTESTLPHMPAWRLSQWLSNNVHTRQVPLIVFADEADEPGNGGPPPACVLVKPFSLIHMLDELRRVIRERQPA